MPRKLKLPKMFYVTDEEGKVLAMGIAETEEDFEDRLQDHLPEEDNYFIEEIDEIHTYNKLAKDKNIIEITPPDELEEYYVH